MNYHLALTRPSLIADGNYGPKTQARVKEFQHLNLLPVSGEVGPDTARAAVDVRPVTARLQIDWTKIDYKGSPKVDLGQNRPAGPHLELQMPRPLFNLQHAPSEVPTQQSVNLSPGWLSLLGVTGQAGQQYSSQPSSDGKYHGFWSPYVVNLGLQLLLRKDGKSDRAVAFGGQLAYNQLSAPSDVGSWTAGLYAQVGLNSWPWGPFGPFDPFNMFVQFAAQHQAGAWGGQAQFGDVIYFTLKSMYSPVSKKVEPLVSLTATGALTSAIDSRKKFPFTSFGSPGGQVGIGITVTPPWFK
jgi:hypothetical protein